MRPLASASLNVDGERDLANDVLTRIEERENEVQGRLEQMIKQRAAIPREERCVAWDALRAEAMMAGGELRRLRLLASVAEALLRPASPRPGSRAPRGIPAR